MEFIIGGIILFIILFIIGFFIRRKYYHHVDRLESWKVDIMNRPILDELSKVKQLNMTGQTEELFEKWRKGWDDIVTADLPQVEECLFEAEEYIDKFRFGSAKEVLARIEEILNQTEDKMERIHSEVEELVGSEEKNRLEIEELREGFRKSRKALLAHRHTYGKAAYGLEARLDEMSERIENFNKLTEEGNYLEARELVLGLTADIQDIVNKMESIPDLLTACQNSLPTQLNEVEAGFKEMEAQGYVLKHLGINTEISRLREELAACLDSLEKLQTDKAADEVDRMKANVDQLYDLLEKEVLAKHFVLQNEEQSSELLENIKAVNKEIKLETEFVQQGYHLRDEDLQVPVGLDKKINTLFKRFQQLQEKVDENESAYSYLSEELQDINQQLQLIKSEQAAFSEKLQALRKEEIEAKEKVAELKKKIGEASRMISKSNVPGLPTDYNALLEEAHKNIIEVVRALEEKPLNMPVVQKYLEKAVDTVDHFYKKTSDLIETVMLAEKVIQYGNRYRSKYGDVSQKLQRAESAFRSFDYREALEQAATAIEEVEPGAIKRIEGIVNEELNG
ncbi:septation ring formation regulator EzrA [Rossellomorea vietnamensis]|uniref:Septation ring formation regulator EzrA n=1 Tax=Rossellomorea vietnamensis TaxID=218284 RepID=A0A5D4KHX3_9BACI|nr:septation ring formation regulator EzrA [Rossellomorea vietnamensis]TYR76977.1 septation ring formation regulator EzrA [Rossellomorea vietnamensis]